jgi:hypothetical protein
LSKTLETRVRIRPDRSIATIVFSKVGFSGFEAMASRLLQLVGHPALEGGRVVRVR